MRKLIVAARRKLKLVASRPFDTGSILTTYQSPQNSA